MTKIFVQSPKHNAWWLTASLLFTSVGLNGQANDPNEFPVSNGGSMIASAAAEQGPVMPFAGSGVLTPGSENAGWAPWVPTNDEIRGLPPASSGIGVETVLGTDTRQRLYTTSYPARATALITFSGGYCTGWFYGPNVVATAGHCVHSGGTSGRWHTNVRVWPGYNAGSAPYGSFPAKWVASVSGWTQSRDERYDYGVIKLSTNVGNTVGWFGLLALSGSLNGLPAITQGYPGDKSPAQSQWITSDEVGATHDRQVFYKTDTFGGQSGSPVWYDRPAGSPGCANGPCAYAIHAYGLHGGAPHADHNHGTRIVQAVLNNLVGWRNAP
ncbi:MAG TPA: trypsin-like serine protease [Bryobacteraceae bacterium]|nr:trypsin-like serine protease [Bryobacteraceae bacterium]